jgi:hypothetical protein
MNLPTGHPAHRAARQRDDTGGAVMDYLAIAGLLIVGIVMLAGAIGSRLIGRRTRESHPRIYP